MDLGTIVSVAGTVAAASAAIIAIWQANLARSQAESARRQAHNAEIQTELMRQQIFSTRSAAANEHAKYQAEILLSYAKAIRGLAMSLYPLLKREDGGRNSEAMELYLEARSYCLANLEKNLVDKANDFDSQVEKNLSDSVTQLKTGSTSGWSWSKSEFRPKILVSRKQAEEIVEQCEQSLRKIAADIERIAEKIVGQSA
jgi:hypothetical protein